MRVKAHLEVDVVALETRDEVSVLLEVTAPDLPTSGRRPPATLVVVLDRSGSMSGQRLNGAKRALRDLVDRLDPADSFGLVSFDDSTSVVVPAGPLNDKPSTKRAIDSVTPGGSTDLSAGYLRGLQEVRRAATAGAARLLLISDGHANAGVTDPQQLRHVAASASTNGVTSTTLGYGLGYDETLLGAIARGGNGAELFAEDADSAVGQIAGEVDGLLAQSVQAASLLVTMASPVAGVRIANDLPAQPVPDGIMVELGGFLSGELRKLVLTFTVPGMPALGLARIATLALRYVTVPGLVEETVTIPVHVNVVPGDQAAGRIADPVVASERVYLSAQASKRDASIQLQAGDASGAVHLLRMAQAAVGCAAVSADGYLSLELREESAVLDGLITETTQGSAARASKMMSSDSTLKSRTRGRRAR